MKRVFLLLFACLAGLALGEYFYRAPWTRDLIGQLTQRGDYLGTVHGQAVHERDVSAGKNTAAVTALLAERLWKQASVNPPAPAEMAAELETLGHQFGDEQAFGAGLEGSGFNPETFRDLVADHLLVRRWLEERIAPALAVSEEEARQFYEQHRGRFHLPPRFRAKHLFVAAPEGTPEELMQAKRGFAQELSIRLLADETFDALAAEASEDEATKTRGGDLGYFASHRAPPEVLIELAKLQPGETSAPFQSPLGFHIFALTETKPARELTFEEVREEIMQELANKKRAEAVAALRARLRSGEVL